MGFGKKHGMQDCGLQKAPDIPRSQMVGNISELTQLMKFLGTNCRMMKYVRPSIESFPIGFKDFMLDGAKKRSAGIGSSNGKLNGKSVQPFCITNSIQDTFNRVIRQAECVIGNYPDPELMTLFDH